MVDLLPPKFSYSLKNSALAAMLAFCFFLMGLFFPSFTYSQITSAASGGNWSATSTWIGGVVPPSGQSVIINSNVSVDINTATVNNITVNAGCTLHILNAATATLTYSGNMSVAGRLENNGGLVQTTNGRSFTLSGIGAYIHNPRNVTLLDESIFTRNSEIFSATSTLEIRKWFDTNIPLGSSTRVSGNFGNVILNIPDIVPWEQDDEFMDSNLGVGRIKGTLTVSSGIVRMCDGNAFSTFMEFNDIVINGTGSIIFMSGPSRPLVLNTGNFTDNSTSANYTMLMDHVFNLVTQWNINGSATFGHNFYGIRGTGVNPGGALNIQVTGNLTISGGTVEFVSQASAPLTLNVTGNTTITGNPTRVRFIDGNLGNLNFSTNNFTISAGGDNVIMGGNGLVPQATGIPNILINNDLIVNGASNTYVLDASNTTQKLRLRVGRDFIINGVNSNFTAARSKGALTVHVNNNLTLSAGKFIGQIDTLNSAIDSVFVGGHFLMNSTVATDYFRINYGTGNTFFRNNGNFTLSSTGVGQGIGFTGIFSGSGNMNFHSVGIFTMNAGRFSGIYNNRELIETGNLTFTVGTNFNISAGFFRGIDNRLTSNTGVVNFTVGNLNYSGGNFSGYYSSHTAANTSTFNVNGLLQITFASAAADTFAFIGYHTVGAVMSNMKLNVNIAGNFNITGPNGSFISSLARGREVVNVTGNVNISGGKNSFNSYPNSGLGNPHPVILNFNSNFDVFGGTIYLSAHNDSLVATIGGNMNISNGELVVQGGNTSATLDVMGGFIQTGGTFFLHKNTTEFSYNLIEVTINSDNNAVGDFSHTGGVINFDNNPQSTQVIMNINSPNVTLGGNGSITMASPGSNISSGLIRYGRAGNTNYNRLATTHSLQQVEQQILSGTTLTVVTGNLQIASLNFPSINRLSINSGAILDLQGNQIISNNLQPNSGITISGRLRLTRPQGLYDGTANAAINANGGMNYLALSNSVVEYYGSDNQVITGIGVGAAVANAHKYYNLDINFTGTPNVEFVYPTNVPNSRSVFVRNKLILTNGELNLDNDHNPVSGGRSIIIERDSLTAITRINGYIRSEVYDSSASVIWRVNSRTGPRIIPFGYNSTNYIPFTFDLGSGDADTLIVSTYHTPASDNIPYPPSVAHVSGLTGLNNSANTVDRFWYIQSTGTSSDANLTFVCTPAELGTIVDPRAQAWIYATPHGWQFPIQGNQSTITNGTFVGNADFYVQNWWTLAGQTTPLPVSLLDFTAVCIGNQVELKWTTASELNNSHFTLLKSQNGITYQPVGTIEGKGTTSNLNAYRFTDPNSNNFKAYYKLIQIDYNGDETTYDPIVAMPCNKTVELDVTVYSSTPEELTVVIRNPDSDKFTISLYGLDGKIITSKAQYFEKGLNVVTLNSGNIASGIYFVNVRSATTSTTTKVPIGFIR